MKNMFTRPPRRGLLAAGCLAVSRRRIRRKT